MADPLYLSLWFPNFDSEDIPTYALAVLKQFPYSAQQPGIGYIAIHPVSWNEPTILEQRFRPGIALEDAVRIASELLHEDYAFVFEAYWDLWMLPEGAQDWVLQPSQVTFIVRGVEFDEGSFQQDGHIQVDFGLDAPFLQEQVQLTSAAEARRSDAITDAPESSLTP